MNDVADTKFREMFSYVVGYGCLLSLAVLAKPAGTEHAGFLSCLLGGVIVCFTFFIKARTYRLSIENAELREKIDDVKRVLQELKEPQAYKEPTDSPP